MVINSKKIKIIFYVIMPLIVFGGFYLVTQAKTIEPIQESSTNSSYLVESQLEPMAKTAVPAVEAFANQDKKESTSDRNQRLSLYFTGDSSVYSSSLDNVSASINRCTSKALSVKEIESEVGTYSLEVKVQLTLYSGKKTSSQVKSYWISLTKIYDGSMFPNNIGEE